MSNHLSKPFRETISLCPVCYKRIPALISLSDNSVVMKKACSEHGETTSMVERDIEFYMMCLESAAPTIYSGYFMDVTARCNLKCKYCYFPVDNKAKDRSIENIMQDASSHRPLAPFLLTGGEPALREDLPEIITGLQRLGHVELVTNGTGPAVEEVFPLLTNDNGIASVNLSWHPEIKEENTRFLLDCRERGVRLGSVLFVIGDIDEIDEIFLLCEEWSDVILATRIKAAARVWNEQKPQNKIFVSDMLKRTEALGARVAWWKNNKVSFANATLGGINHMLVSWYDRFNVDMLDISCAPYYEARTGETMNILTTMLINEGLQNGWLNGNRLSGRV